MAELMRVNVDFPTLQAWVREPRNLPSYDIHTTDKDGNFIWLVVDSVTFFPVSIATYHETPDNVKRRCEIVIRRSMCSYL